MTILSTIALVLFVGVLIVGGILAIIAPLAAPRDSEAPTPFDSNMEMDNE